ncbi:protein C21orf2 homolog isoform X2 [Hyposmocoma kahamanoa]|uniref:protein C21orf2 homolog isoform X2 n=1 Tax=Hyposmocoma kahamanoa TaxID=1477025 RepID=UPI000E6D95C8|nr:protein C21orf2 homolog isoform X2 [Hyposmocoma kahamanoa]
MARLTEEMVIARTKLSDLSAIKKLNCWGAEIVDVSLLRRMPNVEVLALSINRIRTLNDFAWCRRLRELYVRKNEINDLREIRHLRRLPLLTSLWLDENPCTQHPEYRMTVLRNLPNLEKLDNVPVHPEEVSEAMRRGSHIPDSDDEGYPQQPEYARRRSSESSPEREGDHFAASHRTPHAPHAPHTPHAGHGSRPHRLEGSDSSEGAPEPPAPPDHPRQETLQSPEVDERYEHPAASATSAGPPPAMTRSHYEEYSYASNGDCRYGGGAGEARGATSPPHFHEPYYDRPERSESCQQVPQRCPAEVWERESARDRDSARERDREYPSAVMAEHRGFTRRPVTRNSNLLSAVLCLVKELDYPSLEVAEMAVRCRMDELANSQ